MKIILLCLALAFQLSQGADPTSGPGLRTVVIDPGHGGRDPGCVSRDGRTYEKDIVCTICTRLATLISESCPDVKVLGTRTDDTFIPLINRAKFATRSNADLFISIHVNAQPKGTNANGFGVYLLGQSKDKSKDTYGFNMDVCQRENSVIYLEKDYKTTYKGLNDNDPQSAIFLNLMHTAYREQSLLFADKVNEKMAASGVFRRTHGVIQDNFAVLRLATMPAVLLELGFISNPEDLDTLRDPESLEKIAVALKDAFIAYKELYDATVKVERADAPLQKDTVAVKPAQTPVATASAVADTARTPSPAAQEKPAPEAKAAAPADTVSKTAPRFGTQIFASSYVLSPDDARFLGMEAKMVAGERVNRYVIGLSGTIEEAREKLPAIKENYPDSFLVEIVGEELKRVR